MTDGYLLDPGALERDADRWTEWRDRLDGMRAVLPHDVSSLDFSQIPGAQDVYASFVRALGFVDEYISDGSDEFETFAAKLLQTTENYLRAGNFSAEDIARVAGKLDDL